MADSLTEQILDLISRYPGIRVMEITRGIENATQMAVANRLGALRSERIVNAIEAATGGNAKSCRLLNHWYVVGNRYACHRAKRRIQELMAAKEERVRQRAATKPEAKKPKPTPTQFVRYSDAEMDAWFASLCQSAAQRKKASSHVLPSSPRLKVGGSHGEA